MNKIIIIISLIIIFSIIFIIISNKFLGNYKILFNIFRTYKKNYYLLNIHQIEKENRSKFKHKLSLGKQLPFTGAAIFKDNNIEYIYVGGGFNQNDALLLYDKSKHDYNDYIHKTNLLDLDNKTEPTYGIVSIDLNKDGKEDLIIARNNGLFLYKNKGNLQFEKQVLLENDNKVSPFSITIGDYDKDQKADIYVSKFIKPKYLKNFQFNNDKHIAYNTMLHNISDDNEIKFEDTTKETNTKGTQNTFGSIFADINNDKQPDLIIANDTGTIEILENQNGKFYRIDNNISGYGFFMGIGISDIDNDEDFDLFFTNVGSEVKTDKYQHKLNNNQIPNNKHILLRNDGQMKFVDITKNKNLTKQGFGWGGVFMPVNYDIHDDLIFAQNYVILPKVIDLGYIGNYNMKTKKYDRIMKYLNPTYGNSNIKIDLDKDGRYDIVWINTNDNIISHLNESKKDYINIEIPNNIKYTNAIIKVYLNNGKILSKQFISGGEGFLTDHSSTISFGLGKKKLNKINKVTIETIYNNKLIIFNNPINNSTIKIKK